MYDDLVKRLRAVVDGGREEKCDGCPYEEDYPCCVDCLDTLHKQAADAIEELTRNFDSIYPLTITKDRYRGTYSGGRFTAWNCHPDDIPEEISLDDVSCYEWWYSSNTRYVGRGDSPLEAVSDLHRRILHLGEEREK